MALLNIKRRQTKWGKINSRRKTEKTGKKTKMRCIRERRMRSESRKISLLLNLTLINKHRLQWVVVLASNKTAKILDQVSE